MTPGEVHSQRKIVPCGMAQKGGSSGPIVPSGPLTFFPSDTNCLTQTSTNPHWYNNLKIAFFHFKKLEERVGMKWKWKNNSNKKHCWIKMKAKSVQLESYLLVFVASWQIPRKIILYKAFVGRKKNPFD